MPETRRDEPLPAASASPSPTLSCVMFSKVAVRSQRNLQRILEAEDACAAACDAVCGDTERQRRRGSAVVEGVRRADEENNGADTMPSTPVPDTIPPARPLRHLGVWTDHFVSHSFSHVSAWGVFGVLYASLNEQRHTPTTHPLFPPRPRLVAQLSCVCGDKTTQQQSSSEPQNGWCDSVYTR